MTTVLILAADDSHDDRDQGYPLCLAEIGGKPLIQQLIERCLTITDVRLVVAMRDGDCKRWHLDSVVHQLAPTAKVLRVARPTAGAACTALLAVCDIDVSRPLLIINGNELIDIDYQAPIARFIDDDCEGGTVTFPSVHPRYSYVRLDDEGTIIETAEKNPISRHATAGYYWFTSGQMFVDAVERNILKGGSLNGTYYICPVLNELVLLRRKLGAYHIDAKRFHPVKSERQVERLDVGGHER